MGVPTRGETFAKLLEHLRYAQENAAMMGHIENANDHRDIAILWLQFSDLLGHVVNQTTELARRGIQ